MFSLLLDLVSPAGETFSATSAEYFSLKQQLESECFAPEAPGEAPRYYSQLPHEQRAAPAQGAPQEVLPTGEGTLPAQQGHNNTMLL